eukprot:834360-Lingulodinium_polyedra.AAC.1
MVMLVARGVTFLVVEGSSIYLFLQQPVALAALGCASVFKASFCATSSIQRKEWNFSNSKNATTLEEPSESFANCCNRSNWRFKPALPRTTMPIETNAPI